MFFRDVIELISTTETVNGMGDTIDQKAYRQVFADKQSIRQSEFYQAAATGLKPELMFVIRVFEYQNEQSLRYNDKEYGIIRTYSKDGEMIELICAGIVGTEVRQND